MEFKLHSEYKPTGDQPQAIAELVEGFKQGNQFQTLLGVTGSGKTFDHALLSGFSRPYLLAGGLSPENIGGILAEHKPYGVDISSGVETDGQKDADKIRAFVKAVRGE